MLLDVQPGFAVLSYSAGSFDLGRTASDVGCPVSGAVVCPSVQAVTWGLPSLDNGATLLLSAVTSRSGLDVPASEIGHLLERDDVEWLRAMLPPFGAVRVFGEAVKFAVDAMGFRQLYITSGRGFVAVSTSARVLARLIGS